jgi:hypothetical protein
MASGTRHEPNGHGIANPPDNEIHHARFPHLGPSLRSPLPHTGDETNESLREFHDNEWTDGEFTQLAMSQALRGMEDDAVIYTRDDIKERWQ